MAPWNGPNKCHCWREERSSAEQKVSKAQERKITTLRRWTITTTAVKVSYTSDSAPVWCCPLVIHFAYTSILHRLQWAWPLCANTMSSTNRKYITDIDNRTRGGPKGLGPRPPVRGLLPTGPQMKLLMILVGHLGWNSSHYTLILCQKRHIGTHHNRQFFSGNRPLKDPLPKVELLEPPFYKERDN